MTGSSHFSSSLCDLFFEKNLVQLISDPTHTHGNILDIVATNSALRISNVSVDPLLCQSYSDHFLVTFSIHSNSSHHHNQSQNYYVRFNFRQADLGLLADHLLDIDLSHFSSNNVCVDSLWFLLKEKLAEACEAFVPKLKIPTNPSPRWFTAEIRYNLKKIHSLRRALKKKPSPSKDTKLRNLEATVQEKIVHSKIKFESNMIESFSSNPSKLYSHLKFLGRSKFVPEFLLVNSSPVYDQVTRAQLFNEFFNSTFTNSNFVLPAEEELPTPTEQLNTIAVDPSEVYKILSKLNPSKAAGPDNIHPQLLKSGCLALYEPTCIANLFSLCLNTSSLPDEWKIHKIIPIPKKGDLSDVRNYRPISLLSIVSKVLERIVFDKVLPFIGPKLSDHQFGFMKNRSSLSQLLLYFSDIFNSVENKRCADVIYMDFSKAFDSVPHQELLLKLWRLGITGPLWKWFKSYLLGRHHFVSIDQQFSSSSLPVLSGVPQGSILGPLLFIVYVNDITIPICHSSVYLFADDTKLIKSILITKLHPFKRILTALNPGVQNGNCPLMRTSV